MTRFTPEQKHQHLERQKQSGLNISEYCRQHNLCLKNFYNWRSKQKHISQNQSEPIDSDEWLEIEQPQAATQPPIKPNTKVTLSLPGNMSLTIETH